MLFDRALDFGHGSLVDAQLGNFPGVVTSCSQDAQNTGKQIFTKREEKIPNVEMAINAVLAVEIADSKERKERDSAKLAGFLNSPFRD